MVGSSSDRTNIKGGPLCLAMVAFFAIPFHRFATIEFFDSFCRTTAIEPIFALNLVCKDMVEFCIEASTKG